MGEKKHSVNLVFTLALLGLFALSALFVAVLGAQVYGRTVEQMDDNYNARTSLVYITEKVRQCPGKDIRTEKVGDSQALVLNQKLDGKDYESWIFNGDGKLREVLIPKGETVVQTDGQEIMDVNSFELMLEGNLLEIQVFDQFGDTESVTISISD